MSTNLGLVRVDRRSEQESICAAHVPGQNLAKGASQFGQLCTGARGTGSRKTRGAYTGADANVSITTLGQLSLQ